MAISLNGSTGVISGITDLPDAIIDADMLASNAVTTAKINDDAVTDAKQSLSGAAKAWINFNGTGTIAIRDSFNVSAITDDNTGRYTITFTNALSDTNYCPVRFANSTSTAHYESFDNQWGGGMTLETTNLKVSSYGSSAFADSAQFFVVVFGG